MKLRCTSARLPGNNRRLAAFTLPEAMIALTLFALLILGIVSVNLFGLRWYQLGQTDMVATDSARVAMGKMTGEIQNCSSVLVGNISNGVFVAHVAGEPLTGDSAMIYSLTNTNNYVLYYLNVTNKTFIRFESDLNTNQVIAQTVTNTVLFQAQRLPGNVLTNAQNNFVVHCSLQFYSAPNQNPAPNCYQLQTSVAPRSDN